MPEEIHNPQRYTQHHIECWDLALAGQMHFLPFSVMKYIWRYRDKNGLVDLDKALVFLSKMEAEADILVPQIMQERPFSPGLAQACWQLRDTMHPSQVGVVFSLVSLPFEKPDVNTFLSILSSVRSDIERLRADLEGESSQSS